jgi:hypothetical protein
MPHDHLVSTRACSDSTPILPQTLSRTVRGMSYYHEAIRLLAEVQDPLLFSSRRSFLRVPPAPPGALAR